MSDDANGVPATSNGLERHPTLIWCQACHRPISYRALLCPGCGHPRLPAPDLAPLRDWAVRLQEMGVSGWHAMWNWFERRHGRQTPLQSPAPAAEERVSVKAPVSIADIPPALRRQLQTEAVEGAFYRLELPLRFLLYATEPGCSLESTQEYRDILDLWRHGLAQEIQLVPDTFAGAVRSYEPDLDRIYTLRGPCRSGQPVRILVPCWRLHGKVVVRGEAEPITADGMPAGAGTAGAALPGVAAASGPAAPAESAD